MPWRLLRFALSRKYPEPRMFREHERLRERYDAVIDTQSNAVVARIPCGALPWGVAIADVP